MSERKKTTSKKEDTTVVEVKKKRTVKKKEDEPIKEEKVVEKKVKRVTKKTKEESLKKEVLLDKKEQKYFRGITRFVSIIAKIVRVCLMILVPILLVVMIMIPIMSKNIEFNGNIIRFNDARFVLHGDSIVLNIGNKNHVIAENIKDMEKIVKFFNDNSIKKITTNILLSLAFIVVTIIIDIYIFQNIEKLFDNLYRHKTPFENENCDYIKKIGKLMIISFVVTIIFGLILNLVIENNIINKSSYSVMEIIVVYVCYFVFKYGTNMQKKVDTVIYD